MAAMIKQQKTEAAKRRDETLSTFKKIDNNIWLMEYKCSYGLDALLEKGVSNIMDAVTFLQKEVQLPHLYANVFRPGAGC